MACRKQHTKPAISQLKCLRADQVLGLANAHRVVGVRKRTWTFATTRKRTTVLVSPPPRYLFRGQTERHVPCYPSMHRHLRSPSKFLRDLSRTDAAKIVADVAKTFSYFSELDKHPIFEWAKSEFLELPATELAQHYGIPTALIDLTESIEVALFFATHRRDGGGWKPCENGKGVLYRVDRDAIDACYRPRFQQVAIQPFLRPFRQWAWTCELLMGECFEQYPKLQAVEFEHDAALAHEVRRMAESEGELFPHDILADVAQRINDSRVLPDANVISAVEHLGPAYPKDVFGPIRRFLASEGYTVGRARAPVLTDEELSGLERKCETELPDWHRTVVHGLEQILVRRGNGPGKPLEWTVVGPDSVKLPWLESATSRVCVSPSRRRL